MNSLTLMMEEVWFLKQIFKAVCIEFVAKMVVCIEFVAKMAAAAASWADGIFVMAECIDLSAEQFAFAVKMLQVWSVISTVHTYLLSTCFHGCLAAAGLDSYWILSIVIF